LHRLVYVAAVLGIVHFLMRVKADTTEPLIYGSVLALLLAIRVVDAARKRLKKRVDAAGRLPAE
jgi:sulfoxide reductase heme-binding subunit YedZ